MKKLMIEWPHLEKDKQTCLRCAETGKEISVVVEEIVESCAPTGVHDEFKETKLGEEDISKSNSILFNGAPIEEVLPNAWASTNHCGSCSKLTGKETYCRTVEYDGETYAAIPGSLIRKAACSVAKCCDA
ncbi:MAG: DUF2703 domain-containing protein [Pseudanabaenales cyanobacterium]|nr:DUF2703 domain-containing protein [Pseudanabaenales cyanobacterium]